MDLKLYIVLKGRVRVYRDEDKNIEFLGKPDLVELMLLDDAYLGVSGKHEDEQDSNLPNPILPLKNTILGQSNLRKGSTDSLVETKDLKQKIKSPIIQPHISLDDEE